MSILSKYETSPPTPVEKYIRRRKKIGCLSFLGLLVIIVLIFMSRCGPETHASLDEHFKYGSIGSDIESGLPIELLSVLPKIFPGYLPEKENSPQRDLTAFGFIQEKGADLPIGFSRRDSVVPLAGLNCAACHTGVVRNAPDQKGEAILGMPANQLRLQQFFSFLFACVEDPDFTPEKIYQEMKNHGFRPGPADKFLYTRLVIPQFQGTLLSRKGQLSQFFSEEHPQWGAGRVDTFNPYKRIQFAKAYFGKPIPYEESIGNSDYPSLWNQGPRAEMNLHWDGNNNSIHERNLSASFGAGATPQNLDKRSLRRIEKWMRNFPPPKFEDYFPGKIDQSKLEQGKAIYQEYCHDCHSFDGKLIGTVTKLEDIGTSEWRLNSYTTKLNEQQKAFADYYKFSWDHFHKTDGYANAPLDGVWARAPYLHNGSVPTMWDLLTPESDRPKEPFYRGHGVIDTENLGIKTDVERANDLPAWKFDISIDGNSNRGHSGKAYGTELSDEEKRALIEYLKTL